ncbi:prolipoprotein diacylglyceryl transferase [Actinomyces bowdenii]|uniref:Phosphatidylglycerol--prolipoprotein diacylglyceryl transferase n=1 Tax=Actinomyces bowdenii TaxID=131109 RepID=A0A3P1UMH5_9ACTO|nr:prolipoprotein diacylglyceryl transferase [Actinomyces bowdenii]RRD23139.1 prolipoprotein diacylglyceryl transferase [Actinomyces bowdenii]
MLTSALATIATAAAPASLPSPSTGVWHIGPFPLRAYALCILAGVFVAVWWSGRRYEARGGDKDTVLDVALLAVPAGILGARLYHVLSSPDAYFGPGGDPALIPQIWRGGLGIWGGIAAGVAAGAWLMRRRGLRLAPLADSVAPALLVAQAIGRLGNWFNQELFGAPTTLPWGLEIDAAHLPPGYAPGTLFHPTFLYEALWNLAGAALLVGLGRRLLARDGVTGGRLLWAYLMVYTAGRVWIEALRIDDAETIAGLRLNVWTSMLIFAVGAVGLALASRGAPRRLDDSITSIADGARPRDEEEGAVSAPEPGREPEGGAEEAQDHGPEAARQER